MEIIQNAILNNGEYILRIILACICGGVVGFERTRRKKEAGLRTHIIVAVGATLMMIVSKYGFFDVVNTPGIRVDASRIASNIITGISFLGAGVIFVKEVSIKGLTTAAGLWATTGIGLALGAGMYTIGIFTTIFIPIIQTLLHSRLNKMENTVYDIFSITYYNVPERMEALKSEMAARGIEIHHVEMEKNEDDTITVVLDVSRAIAVTCSDLSSILAKDPMIKSFKI